MRKKKCSKTIHKIKKYFLNLMKTTNIRHSMNFKISKKISKPRHIALKMFIKKDKGRTLKTAREK